MVTFLLVFSALFCDLLVPKAAAFRQGLASLRGSDSAPAWDILERRRGGPASTLSGCETFVVRGCEVHGGGQSGQLSVGDEGTQQEALHHPQLAHHKATIRAHLRENL